MCYNPSSFDSFGFYGPYLHLMRMAMPTHSGIAWIFWSQAALFGLETCPVAITVLCMLPTASNAFLAGGKAFAALNPSFLTRSIPTAGGRFIQHNFGCWTYLAKPLCLAQDLPLQKELKLLEVSCCWSLQSFFGAWFFSAKPKFSSSYWGTQCFRSPSLSTYKFCMDCKQSKHVRKKNNFSELEKLFFCKAYVFFKSLGKTMFQVSKLIHI